MLSPAELIQLKNIEEKYYMQPILVVLNTYTKKHGYDGALDYLHEILVHSKLKVDEMLNKRILNNEIKDISQARKSIAGAAFSNCIIYLFLKAKEHGDVQKDIFITDKTKSPLFLNMVTIRVGGETQKPDMDLVIYKLNGDETIGSCIIISLKTSLRERAGQTYKWKLLLEIATSENVIKRKYDIQYDSKKMPLVCFATVNFYDEINNPQHKGMFKFFDHSFIGKPVKKDFISNLSDLIPYANANLK